MSLIDTLTNLVGSMEWYWTVLLILLVFNMMAGVLGLDGGQPKPKDQYSPEQLQDESNTRVFIDVDMDGERIGRIVLELFDKLAPKAVENFRCLCTGEKGMGKEGKPLHYKGCGFHRIIPKFMCQGGDITAGDGTGGESIYNGMVFENEFENGFMTHDREGLLSMANSGPNSNSSQFFITTGKCAWLDLRHVAFGVVLEGMDVVQKMNTVGSRSGKPSAKVVIADCGQLKKDTKKTQ